MRFQVPQFIEIEDKIFGPLTFKQFIYIAGAGGMAVGLWVLLPAWLAMTLALPIVAFGLALAFYKINNKPFIYIVEAFFKYSIGSKLYIWKKIDPKVSKSFSDISPRSVSGDASNLPKISEGNLRELTWNLNIRNGEHAFMKNHKV